jgi:hypothetical protein
VAFSLDSSAVTTLTKMFAQSGCLDAVAVIGNSTQMMDMPAELYSALNSGDEQLAYGAARREFDRSSERLKWFLEVSVYEKESRLKEDFLLVDGIEFELPLFLREFLQNVCLFYENEEFVLRDREGVVVNLQNAYPQAFHRSL